MWVRYLSLMHESTGTSVLPPNVVLTHTHHFLSDFPLAMIDMGTFGPIIKVTSYKSWLKGGSGGGVSHRTLKCPGMEHGS